MSKYDENNELRCSFCGKPQSQVKRLISGSGVYICNECIDLCQDILAAEESRVSGEESAITAVSYTHLGLNSFERLMARL